MSELSEIVNMSAMRLKKPERKIIEKNRRNQMKILYSHLFSLIPPHIISKGSDQVADRVDRTIEYIRTLQTNLEMNKNYRDKLLSKKRSHQHTKMVNKVCEIHQMTHDLDAVLVTGLEKYSSFCKVVRFLDQYCTEVTLANFSSNGHSTFHIRQKKIEAEEICKKLKKFVENMEFGDNTNTSFHNEQVDSDISIWNFDFEGNVWGAMLL